MENSFNFRTDKETLSVLEEKAREQNISKSEYIRRLIKNRPVDYQDIDKSLKELRYELGKIGTNINQIAKNMNCHIYSVEDRRYLLEIMKRLYLLFQEVHKRCLTEK